ncbi:hypothetical protein ACIGN6_30350 [Streptomyces sp. NPDC053792]|uniref:hypothetical protein n=1 Tax=Streptomyces sp. NPDC053792 TaxID=3365716 RepID=UPI0037CD4170
MPGLTRRYSRWTERLRSPVREHRRSIDLVCYRMHDSREATIDAYGSDIIPALTG